MRGEESSKATDGQFVFAILVGVLYEVDHRGQYAITIEAGNTNTLSIEHNLETGSHWFDLERTTEGFYDTALNEADDA